MKVKPSARIKRRYIRVVGSKGAVEKAILDYIGILGWAKAKVVWVGTERLAVSTKGLKDVLAALELGKIEVKKVSGTLKGLGKI
ncbi:hypothetical protein CMI47_14190 [Candidatus Pacearchaeota archaeon]|nr:hypothetical protein [Candidatus Pacearchaeota archaeon]|tara:strand:- start:2469 stop:2720 length:252 start_codon:yes stop_codon:yes gene_type:complete